MNDIVVDQEKPIVQVVEATGNEFVSSTFKRTEVVAVEQASSVTQTESKSFLTVEQEAIDLVIANTDSQVVTTQPQTSIIMVGGYVGGSGSASGGAGVFITDITPTGSGIVGSKVYADTIPVDAVIDAATSDTTAIRVHVGCNGGADNYSPSVIVNGVAVTLTQSGTIRWFTGYADITISAGVNSVVATSSEGTTWTADVTLAGAGTTVESVTWGSYPGSQTALKNGDLIPFTATTDLTGVSITIEGQTFSVSGGNASGNLVVGAWSTGSFAVTATAKNSFGTTGATFNVPVPLNIDQTYPTISGVSVSYPATQGAFGAGQSGTVNCTITNYDSMSYSSANFSIGSPTVYATNKAITNTASGYITANNITISATRADNNATTTTTCAGIIATVAATAAVTITGNPAQLVGSPSGQAYTVNITPNQTLASAPSMNATAGTWSGSWTLSGGVWSRNLIIADSTPRGVGDFTALNMTGLSGITGSTITSGSTYIVGGMTSRILTYAAYARVAALGAAVYNQSNTSASYTGGNTLSLHTDNGVYVNGYYIANSDGSYNPNGAYLGISDTAFAGSNTTGTLELTFAEAA